MKDKDSQLIWESLQQVAEADTEDPRYDQLVKYFIDSEGASREEAMQMAKHTIKQMNAKGLKVVHTEPPVKREQNSSSEEDKRKAGEAKAQAKYDAEHKSPRRSKPPPRHELYGVKHGTTPAGRIYNSSDIPITDGQDDPEGVEARQDAMWTSEGLEEMEPLELVELIQDRLPSFLQRAKRDRGGPAPSDHYDAVTQELKSLAQFLLAYGHE